MPNFVWRTRPLRPGNVESVINLKSDGDIDIILAT